MWILGDPILFLRLHTKKVSVNEMLQEVNFSFCLMCPWESHLTSYIACSIPN